MIAQMNGLKERKVLQIDHSFEHNNAAMIIEKTARHWRQKRAWRIDYLFVHQRGVSFLQKN
jgi:hypothetical protein